MAANVTNRGRSEHITKRMNDENVKRERGCANVGNETFAIAVFDGPVFRNIKKIATNMATHAAGKGT